MGRTLTYAGRAEEAIPLIKDGLRLNPLAGTTLTLGNALRETGQYEAALAEYKKVIEGRPNKIIAYQCLSVTYAMSGSFEEARKAWSEVLKLDPRMTVEKNFAKPWPYGPEHRQRLISAMHQAGID